MARPEPPRQLSDGSVVAGKYKVLGRLGGGGMGDVYRAEHQLAGRVVALKLLRRDFAEDPDLVRRFFQEAQAVNRIRHPNIVDVLDAGFSEEGPYVAMECLDGLPVSEALARVGRFDAATALSVIMPVLDALDAAHRVGIVHRDLKPENIFVARLAGASGGEARVKILDFGIAKVTDAPEGAARPQTHTGVIFGTPDYLSPEQASGDGVVDGRSDIFAAGIVLFELLTGRRPFEAKSAVATAYRIVHEPAPRLAAMGVAIDARVQDALDIALAKTQADRFATAGTFADMLAPLVPEGVVRRESLAGVLRAPSARPVTDPRALSPDRPQEIPPAPSVPPAAPSVSPMAPTLASTDFNVGLGFPTRDSSPRPPAVFRERSDSSRRELESSRPSPAPPLTSSWPPPRHSPVPSSPRAADTTSAIRARATTTSGASRRTAWAPRPLPLHVVGTCHVRGSFPRAVSKWVERAFGADARDRVVGLLPPEAAESFRNDTLNALVWYDIAPVDMFIEAATAILMDGQAGEWRKLARESFEKDLGPILRTTTRLVDPATMLARSTPAWSRIFDFGPMRILTSQRGRAVVRVEAFDAASLALRYVVVGTMDGLLESAGVSAPQIRVLAGESSFSRELEFEVSWRA